MTESPYAPPRAEVADVLPKQHVSWGRLIWLQLPIFAALVFLALIHWEALRPGFASWGGWVGLAFAGVLLYLPVRAIRNLSEAAPPWWWDVLYYSSVALCIGGLIRGDENYIVAGGMPTLLLLGVTTVLAVMAEKRRSVRVYVSGRRYLFKSTERAL